MQPCDCAAEITGNEAGDKLIQNQKQINGAERNLLG
jgi:hypothetical protein